MIEVTVKVKVHAGTEETAKRIVEEQLAMGLKSQGPYGFQPEDFKITRVKRGTWMPPRGRREEYWRGTF